MIFKLDPHTILPRFTATKAFKLMLNEINDLAGQHEVIAENLSTAVVSDLTILVKSMRDDRRKVRKLFGLKEIFDEFVY